MELAERNILLATEYQMAQSPTFRSRAVRSASERLMRLSPSRLRKTKPTFHAQHQLLIQRSECRWISGRAEPRSILFQDQTSDRESWYRAYQPSGPEIPTGGSLRVAHKDCPGDFLCPSPPP